MSNTKRKLNRLMKEGDQIVCVTCYDSSFSKILDKVGIDIVLVGDSLGMVIKGEDNTHSVTMNNILYHVSNVAKNKKNFILMADMPKNSYEDYKTASRNAKELLKNKVDIVKIEYRDDHREILETLISQKIPICAHIGLLPQYVYAKKDMRIYGKNSKEFEMVFQQAKTLEKLGVEIILLECVNSDLAKKITNSVKIPVIGIGSGENCNGQVQVLYDLIGISNNPPKFAQNFLKKSGSIEKALKDFYRYVKSIKIK